jgi:hypothetical protein
MAMLPDEPPIPEAMGVDWPLFSPSEHGEPHKEPYSKDREADERDLLL